MKLDFQVLTEYEVQGKVTRRAHPTRDLHVWCYTPKTVRSNDWDDVTRMCRGLVTDGLGNVVSRPFPKFVAVEADVLLTVDSEFWAYDKLDGTLIVVSTDAAGERVVSSKGSFTAWQIELAELLLANWKPRAGWTAMFELIDPANRIVVDYGTASGLTLLGATDNESGENHFDPDDVADGMDWFGDTAIPREFNLQNMLQTISNPDNGVNKEGFVVVYPNPNGPSVRVKLKFARYREAHRTLSRLSNLVVWEALASDGLARLMEIVPDKLYREVVECADVLVLARATVESNARRDLSKLSKLPTRREQAAHVKNTAMDNPKLVFALLDGRDITQGSWDVVKPHPVVPWSFLS